MASSRFQSFARIKLLTPLGVICVAASALCVSTYSVFGHTWDEPEHLAAGVALLDTGDYPYDRQHPPLARIAMALGPVIAGAHSHGNAGPSGEEEGRDILYDEGRYDLYLTLARIGLLPFLLATLIGTWLWTRRLFGAPEALIATALTAATPVIIGHASVAALDMPMVGTSMIALYCLYKWFENRTLSRAVLFGLALGIAGGTKLSSIAFVGSIALAWLSVAVVSRSISSKAPEWRSSATLIQITAGFIAALVAMLACFGFRVDLFAASFSALLEHNQSGHLSYFMGELRRTGWWNFYVIGMTVKTPLPLLIAGLAGSAWLLVKAYRDSAWRLAAPALAWIVTLVFASAFSQINIGIRHVLLIYPLLAMNAAALIAMSWRRAPRPVWRVVAIAIVAWQGISLIRTHPDHLAYFNELAGDHPEDILVDSDLDWGQDLKRLKQVLHERKIEHIGVVYRGTADLSREGFPSYEFVWPHKPATGWLAVALLARATGSEDGGYDWLDRHKPVERVGKTIDLYYIETRDTGRGTRQN